MGRNDIRYQVKPDSYLITFVVNRMGKLKVYNRFTNVVSRRYKYTELLAAHSVITDNGNMIYTP